MSCKPDNTVIISKHENGRIAALLVLERPITSDSSGIKKLFFEDGSLQCYGGYKNNLRNGTWTCYYKNGDIKWKANYVNDIEDGEVYCKYADSSWVIKNVKNGIKEGETVEYVFDTIFKKPYFIFGQYKNDKEEGQWIWEYPNGQIIKKINFLHGINHGIFEEYYPNGNIKLNGNSYHKKGEDFIRYDDSLFHYHELPECTIDSIEIFNEGALIKVIK